MAAGVVEEWGPGHGFLFVEEGGEWCLSLENNISHVASPLDIWFWRLFDVSKA